MENVKRTNIFVIPIENENLNRSGIDAYVYLYCVEKGLPAPFHNECLLLHLKRDFPFRYHLHAILFNYPVRKQFRTLARQNWQLLKPEVISRILAQPDIMHTNSCCFKSRKCVILTPYFCIVNAELFTTRCENTV